MEIIIETFHRLILLLTSPFNHGMMQFALRFIPFFLFLELPVYILVLLGIIRYYVRKDTEIPEQKIALSSCLLIAVLLKAIAKQIINSTTA